MEYQLCLWMTAVNFVNQYFGTAFRSYDRYVYVFLCYVVCVQCLVCLLLLIAVASDSCRCPGCVRLSLALRTLNFVHYVRCVNFLRKTIAYAA